MVDHELVKQRLRTIAARNNGTLTPKQVVDDAREPGSPLHELFEWDAAKGHEIYLLNQARAVIRSVKVTVLRSETTFKAPLYVRNPELNRREAGYVSITRLRTDAELAREQVVAEFAAATAALKRARAIAAALEVSEEIDALIGEVRRVSQSVQAPASGMTN